MFQISRSSSCSTTNLWHIQCLGHWVSNAADTNTGATMSTATTGTERVVLTNIFTGTMTDGKTDPQLTFDFATNVNKVA